MNNIKTSFTIKDLENLSGIKAHTIRIWEKRYQLLSPERTSGNARYYDTKNLQKLLNVSLLNKNNYKISKIAKLSEESIVLIARELANKNALVDNSINAFKMAMFSFDQVLFNQTYNQLLINKTFRDVFKEVFIPFLDHIGLMWQTDTLTPAHEHFVSNLISQKIQINIEKIQQNLLVDDSEVYVLFLPENEIHELGLMYLNYELSLRGKKTIYLGQSIPLDNLNSLLTMFTKIKFISSFTVAPVDLLMNDYISEIDVKLKNTKHEFWAFGNRTKNLNSTDYNGQFLFYKGLIDLLKDL
ncbi:HTH-type transcriptional repressor CarH [Polaribacter huanghezhanensis]|uniref:MerR family transcriptional regulator n=1 Tax=Polaribacter huanghezhanensis TaxID=1354726 RepID=UPI002647B8BC|nr:MerR family transcriptional regulator [Polaribacter huanghezhanensis]WKD86827.1 HTH-type transcriptional repressor CarH [Polaribacter huanghezhanensis]